MSCYYNNPLVYNFYNIAINFRKRDVFIKKKKIIEDGQTNLRNMY